MSISSDRLKELEDRACSPILLNPDGFNPNAQIPYGCTTEHLRTAMNDFLDFIGFVNTQLKSRQMARLESFLMPANFSSMVGEFLSMTIPKYCKSIVKNTYHNGHPDLLPKGVYEGDSSLHADRGIEIKASRHISGWQGHNPEETWLLVFIFDSNSSSDKGAEPRPFGFVKVVGAQLEKEDWTFSGRSSTSRRTITASVNQAGFAKMEANWIYRGSRA
jgi:hypothetical protein